MQTKSAKVGDTHELSKRATMVRLPDGSVTTCRASYTFRTEGEHVIFDGNATALAKVKVGESK